MNKPEQTHQPSVYPSAVDPWISVMLLMSPVLAAGLSFYMWRDGNNEGASVLATTAVAAFLVTMILVFPCRYTIEADDLHIRCGLLAYRIPLKTIDRIELSRTLASGPALSMKRVKVHTKLKDYVLSPRDREAFIAEVSAAASKKRCG